MAIRRTNCSSGITPCKGGREPADATRKGKKPVHLDDLTDSVALFGGSTLSLSPCHRTGNPHNGIITSARSGDGDGAGVFDNCCEERALGRAKTNTRREWRGCARSTSATTGHQRRSSTWVLSGANTANTGCTTSHRQQGLSDQLAVSRQLV